MHVAGWSTYPAEEVDPQNGEDQVKHARHEDHARTRPQRLKPVSEMERGSDG